MALQIIFERIKLVLSNWYYFILIFTTFYQSVLVILILNEIKIPLIALIHFKWVDVLHTKYIYIMYICLSIIMHVIIYNFCGHKNQYPCVFFASYQNWSKEEIIYILTFKDLAENISYLATLIINLIPIIFNPLSIIFLT